MRTFSRGFGLVWLIASALAGGGPVARAQAAESAGSTSAAPSAEESANETAGKAANAAAELEKKVARDFGSLLAVNRVGALVLIGRLGSEGAPYFYAQLQAPERLWLRAGGERWARVAADFGARGLIEGRRHGDNFAWAHADLGLAALDWADTHPALDLALVARVGRGGLARVKQELTPAEVAQLAEFPGGTAYACRGERDFAAVLRRATRTRSLALLDRALAHGARPENVLRLARFTSPVEFTAACARLAAEIEAPRRPENR